MTLAITGVCKKRLLELVHEKNKPFKCDIWDYSCFQKGDMKKHVASVYEGDKPSNCDICNNCFPKRDKLKRHVSQFMKERRHTGILEYFNIKE